MIVSYLLSRKINKEEQEFKLKLKQQQWQDDAYVCENDIPLTSEEIKEIDNYWKKYEFAYPEIEYKSWKTFKNRCGHFDVRHCPGVIRNLFLQKYFLDRNYHIPFQNKGMLSFLYSNIKQPYTLCRRMNEICLDENFNEVSVNEIISSCIKYLNNNGNLIFKPFGSSGGKGILLFTKETTEQQLYDIFNESKGFVIQEVIKQSSFMARFNDSSVNTIRITTLIVDKKSVSLAAIIRVGKSGNYVDNWHSGGTLLGIDINTGKCCNHVLNGKFENVKILPNGLNLEKENLIIPNFEKVKKSVTDAHYRIPYIKMISWDIALDEDDNPVLIECNFGGEMQMHEATTGAMFGEYLDDLLDECLLKRYYKRFVKHNFLCREYHDHIEIEKYIGKRDRVYIPEHFNNKKVTAVLKTAFVGYHKKVSSRGIKYYRV